MTKRLLRSNSDRMIGGVCGGLAQYFSLDPVLVRLAFALLVLLGHGSGLLLYLILLILMPLENDTQETYEL